MTTLERKWLATTGTPAAFAQTVSNSRWKPARHLLHINGKLDQLARGVIKRLMVFCPPRHGKSMLCSQYFPAWYLGMRPDNRLIFASYEANFAASWGRKARTLIEEYGGLFNVSVSGSSGAADHWDIAGHLGGMITAGIGGPITGKGADIFIVDHRSVPSKSVQGDPVHPASTSSGKI